MRGHGAPAGDATRLLKCVVPSLTSWRRAAGGNGASTRGGQREGRSYIFAIQLWPPAGFRIASSRLGATSTFEGPKENRGAGSQPMRLGRLSRTSPPCARSARRHHGVDRGGGPTVRGAHPRMRPRAQCAAKGTRVHTRAGAVRMRMTMPELSVNRDGQLRVCTRQSG
jgi:hypothetical protein